MNGLKGEKGDPADVLGSRVSTAETPQLLALQGGAHSPRVSQRTPVP